MDLITINNTTVSAIIGDDFIKYQEALDEYKTTTSLATKRFIYNELRTIINQMVLKLENVCNKPNCSTSLQQICWLTLSKREFNLTIPQQDAVEEEKEDMIEANQLTVQPIWRPNTNYLLHFRLKDEVDNGDANPGVYDYYYGFKTEGPVGHFHKHPDVDYIQADTKEEEYPLTSLRQYIDYDRSYPNADGNLLQSKPIFYGHNQCKILLYFSRPLAYHMVNSWDAYLGLPSIEGAMHITIKDPATNVVIPYPLPADFDQSLIPTSQTFATWVEFDSAEELNIPENVSILDAGQNIVGEYAVLLDEYFSISQKHRVRINDDAVLYDTDPALDFTTMKISWIETDENGIQTTVEYPITVAGKEDAAWNVDNDPRVPGNIQLINNMVNYINDLEPGENSSIVMSCELNIGSPIVPNSYSYVANLTNLKPRKLYTALVYNAFDVDNTGTLKSEQVHQFVFQTSRYKNFEEQVNSYMLKDVDQEGNTIAERKAIFGLTLENVDQAEIDTAYNIVAGNADTNSDAIAGQYYDLFDRVIEGVLQMKPLDPPTNTEFNILKDKNENVNFGILVRNPEPFNIPKIPFEDVQDTVKVVTENGQTPTGNYKVLYSKDYSQALIMHEDGEIGASEVSIQFEYKIWNGQTYEISDTVVVDNIQID